MKKKLILFILTLAMALTACTSNPKSQDKSEGANSDISKKLSVYTSIYPLYDFTKKIAGDRADVSMLIDMGAEAHDFEPTASDIAKLEKADLLILNGGDFEHWAEDIQKSFNGKGPELVYATDGIELLENPDHDHDHEEAEHEETEHEHEEAEHEHESLLDPHVWTSPKLAIKQMNNIYESLSKKDPTNKDYYKENLDKNIQELEKLDGEYKTVLEKAVRKDLVVSHKAFFYLAKEYGLNQVGLEGVSHDQEPSVKEMAEIIDYIKAHDVKVIFFEETKGSKLADVISKQTDAKAMKLSTLETLSEEEVKNNDDYFSIMRRNLEAIKEALQ